MKHKRASLAAHLIDNNLAMAMSPQPQGLGQGADPNKVTQICPWASLGQTCGGTDGAHPRDSATLTLHRRSSS